MRSATARWRWFPVLFLRLVLNGIVSVVFYVSIASAQQPPQAGALASDISNIPKTVGDTVDRVNTRNAPNDADVGKKPTETDESCLLPPLSLITRTTVAAEQLQIKPKAKKEYHQACVALRNKNTADAEQHLRKAVQADARYASAWVTLGQTLVMRQLHDEARTACQQGLTADPTYVAAYLCLADIATRTHTWDEVLKLSARALTFDPSRDAVAYEYQAAANLNLRDLVAAEKSALRALEIDKDHREPRVHFVLAQIYEAKGDRNNEALQLREYLKYAGDALTSPPSSNCCPSWTSSWENQNSRLLPRKAAQRALPAHRGEAGRRPTLMKLYRRCDLKLPVPCLKS